MSIVLEKLFFVFIGAVLGIAVYCFRKHRENRNERGRNGNDGK